LNAVGPGSATITATVEGKSGQGQVTVVVPPSRELIAWPDTSRMLVGATRRLALRPTSGHWVAGVTVPASSWESSDRSVATVDAQGQVTAVGVGQATITARLQDRQFTADVFTFRYPASLQFRSVSTSGDHTCALTAGGEAYCWGLNDYGQLGTDAIMDRCARVQTAAGFLAVIRKMRCSEVPVAVKTSLRFTSVSVGPQATCAIATTGAAYCWGINTAGQAGTGNSDEIVRVPTVVAGGFTFRSVDVSGFSACGVSTQNVAYCWGSNVNGVLGDGSESSSATPVRVAGDRSWRSVSADLTTCGTTTAGIAYCWGSNRLGTAGVMPETQSCRNSAPCVTTPTRVGGDVTFSRVETGLGLTCGLSTDGVAYCWGEQAGPSRSTTHVPTLVPGDFRFTSIHTRDGPCALTADGATYCWGPGVTTVDGQSIPFTASPVRSVPAFPLRALDLGGVRCGIDGGGILYCWGGALGGLSALDQFWAIGGGWSVASTTPVRVAGQQ
jgi:alpha-tubulin suppressor-like RCC1 family protein